MQTTPAAAGTSALKFSYEVQSDDEDTNGLDVVAGSLDVTISNEDYTAAYASVSGGSHHTVDGSLEPASLVSDVSFSSSPDTGYKTYIKDQTISIDIEFTQDVALSGTETITLNLDGDRVQAALSGDGSAATTHTFQYTVADGDRDRNGLAVVLGTLNVTVGGVSQQANYWNPPMSARKNHKVNGNRHVRGVRVASSPGSDGVYTAGEVITFDVVFSEAVRIRSRTNAPSRRLNLVLQDGDNRHPRASISNIGCVSLTEHRFSYTVRARDYAPQRHHRWRRHIRRPLRRWQ